MFVFGFDEDEDGKLRFGAFFIYGQGPYKTFLRQQREISISLAAQWPQKGTFVATAQENLFKKYNNYNI